MAQSESERPKPAQKSKSPQFGLIFWTLLLMLFFFYLFKTMASTNRVSLPYSDFKKLVSQGAIAEVTFKDEKLTGSFVRAYPQVVAGDTVQYHTFMTTMPRLEDTDLLPLLEEKGVAINAEAASSPWWASMLIFILPWVLIIGYFMYVSRKLPGQMEGGGLFSIAKSRAKRFRKEKAAVSYQHVAGLSGAKQDLQEIVQYLKDPGKFTKLGAAIPKGVLLVGPPGTGKTLLARATAGEAGVPFFSTSGSEFIEMFVGVGASRVRDLFETAKKDAPAIIFVDELDSVGQMRGTGLGGGHDEREQTLNQILSEMDGFEPHESVVVMAATNRPDVLDPALTRPGRFDRQITLELPQKIARLDILKIHASRVPLDPDVELERVAARTIGFSGADLQNLVNEAALLAGRKEHTRVNASDFAEAQDKILLGAEREEKIDEKEKVIVAFHEAGHALLAKLIPESDPLQKVTIIARGRSLGATEQIPNIERHNFSRNYLLGRIAVALGGRASELIRFNEITNGASQDLKVVTSLARKMVCQWGMSEALGPATFSQSEEHPFLGRELAQPRDFSEHTAHLIDKEVQRIVFEQEKRALEILRINYDKLERLALALMEHETLERDEVDRILEMESGHEAAAAA
jgi:cell division protease FtsH